MVHDQVLGTERIGAIRILMLVGFVCSVATSGIAQKPEIVNAKHIDRRSISQGTTKPMVWPSEPPADIPFPRSRTITGIEFSGTYATYFHQVYHWYPSWGDDDVLYSTYAGLCCVFDSAGQGFHAGGIDGFTGRALIRGKDPLTLSFTARPPVAGPAAPYDGRYPGADLMYQGIWYVGTYALGDVGGSCGHYCVLGPFVGFHWSTDKGLTWHEPPGLTPAHPLFGDTVRASHAHPAKLSAAHFVDFGKGMRYSPDGKAYLIGHGSTAPDARNTWLTGDQIYLARVTPSPETINDVKAWEFYAGRDAKGRPRWSKHFTEIQPLLEWANHLGNVAVTYDAPLKKYLLVTTQGWPTDSLFDTMVLEADQLTGPWRLVTYMRHFGPQAFFVQIPSKFISKDGRTAWLFYSANWVKDGSNVDGSPANPPGTNQELNVQQIRLLGPEK